MQLDYRNGQYNINIIPNLILYDSKMYNSKLLRMMLENRRQHDQCVQMQRGQRHDVRHSLPWEQLFHHYWTEHVAHAAWPLSVSSHPCDRSADLHNRQTMHSAIAERPARRSVSVEMSSSAAQIMQTYNRLSWETHVTLCQSKSCQPLRE